MSKMTLSKGAGAQINMGAVKAYGNPIPYIAPWAVAVTLLALAIAARQLRNDTYAWYWSPLIALAVAAVAIGVHFASRPRGKLVHNLATTGAVLAGAWTWYIAGAEQPSWRPYVVYVIAVIVVCAVANAAVAFRSGGESDDMHDKLRSRLDKLRNINEIEERDGQLHARIEVEPGETVRDAAPELAKTLASLHDLPETGVQITPRRGESVRVGTVRLSPDDRLARPTPWPGPSIAPGQGTLLEPLRLGLRRGGPLQLWLPGDARVNRNASLLQYTGMSGAGKSVAIRFTLIEAMCRGEFEYWYLNSRKGTQEPEWVLGGAARVATKKADVISAWRDLRDEMPERSAYLGKRGLEQWEPGCGMPFRLIIGDEAADWAIDIERVITDVAETVRSIGELPLLGFQRATGSRFPTDARANFGTQLCFGVESPTDAGMGLPEEVLEAGAAPWVWGNREPGRCYLAAPGVPEEQWAEDARTFKPDTALLAEWGERLVEARERGSLTSVSLPSAAVPTGRTVAQVVEDGELLDEDVVDADELEDDEDLVDEATAVLAEVGEEDESAAYDDECELPVVPDDCREVHDIDPREPIDVSGGGMRLAPSPKMSPTEARVFAKSYLIRMRDSGTARFKVEDVGEDILAATGFRGSWLSKVLREFLAEEQRWLRRDEDDRGWYEFSPRAVGRDAT